MEKRIEIEIPSGFMNTGVSTDGYFIADTNDGDNWDTLKFPLPWGDWSIHSRTFSGKIIILQNNKRGMIGRFLDWIR